MTRTETIAAFRQLGGMATRRDIERIVGGNQQHVIQRMIKWKEVRILNNFRRDQGTTNILELLI